MYFVACCVGEKISKYKKLPQCVERVGRLSFSPSLCLCDMHQALPKSRKRCESARVYLNKVSNKYTMKNWQKFFFFLCISSVFCSMWPRQWQSVSVCVCLCLVIAYSVYNICSVTARAQYRGVLFVWSISIFSAFLLLSRFLFIPLCAVCETSTHFMLCLIAGKTKFSSFIFFILVSQFSHSPWREHP